jgi:hypothetical protein
LGLLEAQVERGRDSAREVVDEGRLLDAYATAVEVLPAPLRLQVGVAWRDPVAGLMETGGKWNKRRTDWAATGVAAAAAVIAPYLTTVTSTEVYVDAGTIVGLEAVAADAGLRPIEGGRLTLRPFPTVAVRRPPGRSMGFGSRRGLVSSSICALLECAVRKLPKHLREVIRAR